MPVVFQSVEPVSAEDLANAVRDHLGDAQARRVVQAKDVLDAWFDAQRQAAAIIAKDPSIEPDRAPAFSLASPELPAELAELLFHSLRATFCCLAIVHAVATERGVEPWLALALVGRLVSSARQHLRLLASIPGVVVDEAIVPTADRLALPALLQQHRRARQVALRSLHAARTQTGS